MKHALKAAMVTSILAGSIALNSQRTLADETNFSPDTQVQLKLKGYVFGIKIMRANFSANLNGAQYSAKAGLYTSGLAALLKKFKISANTHGLFAGHDLKPSQHIQQNHNKKNRRVEMNYGEDQVQVNIVPKLGSQGQPPATGKQRFNSDDTLSALLNIMMRGYKTSDKPCSGLVPVFDSKQHYNLRLKAAGTKYIKQRGYKGDTIRCAVYYEPVSGFDPEDLPSSEEAAAPILMYLAKFEAAELYIPVRMTYKISGLKAVIKTKEIKISLPTREAKLAP